MNKEKLLENLIVVRDVRVYSPTLHKITIEVLGEKYTFLVSLKVGDIKLLRVGRKNNDQ